MKDANTEGTSPPDTCNMTASGETIKVSSYDMFYQDNGSGFDRTIPGYGSRLTPKMIDQINQKYKGLIYSCRNMKAPDATQKEQVVIAEKEVPSTSLSVQAHQQETIVNSTNIDIIRWENNAKIMVPLVKIPVFKKQIGKF